MGWISSRTVIRQTANRDRPATLNQGGHCCFPRERANIRVLSEICEYTVILAQRKALAKQAAL
jgi:hypothetical protein